MSLFVETFAIGPIQANCTLLGDTESGELVIIDPGAEAETITGRIKTSRLNPTMILHTHGHLDHAGGTADLSRQLGPEIPVGLHRDELELYNSLTTQGAMFGIAAQSPPQPTLWLEHGQCLKIGQFEVEIRHTPGHSPGSVCFIVSGCDPMVAVVGDVLFAGSIGRTDLWGGSFPVLEASIRKQLYTLPDNTRVICGHGPDTSTGHEKSTNPFVNER